MERKRFLIVGIILLISLSTLVVASLRGIISLDVYWHLQMGKDWLENGLSPWLDHYSFTYYNHSITNPPFAFQAIIHVLASNLGVTTGLQVFRFACSLMTLGASVILLRQMKVPAIIYAVVIPMIVLLLQMRLIARPELISYTFSIIALILYFKARNRISTRNLIPIVLLMLVWSTYHSSIVGYIIFFGFFLDCALAQIKSRAPALVWVKWLAWGGAVLAVGFMNPSFSHPIVQATMFPSEWKIWITEYLPSAPFVRSTAGVYVLLLLAILTPVMAYQQRKFGLLIIWAVLFYSAVTMHRMLTPAGIVIVMLAAHLLVTNKWFNRLSSDSNGRKSTPIVVAMLLLGVVILHSNIGQARNSIKQNRELIYRYPSAMTAYMSERSMSGRVFNEYNIGGYLIYRLTPEVQVYIDGRTEILYPLSHMEKYERLRGAKRSALLREEVDEYAINLIVLEYSQPTNDLIQELGGFGLDFMDTTYALYTRETPNFPLHGILLSSAECWRSDMLNALKAERQLMEEILPSYSGLFPFSDFIIGYANAEDGKAFFDASIDEREWPDEMRKFAGFRFLEMELYEVVPFLLGGVQSIRPNDFFASAFAKIQSEDYEVASQILVDYSNIEWLDIKSEEKIFYYKLLRLLESKRDLKFTEQKRVDELHEQLLSIGFTDFELNQELNFASLCRASMSHSD